MLVVVSIIALLVGSAVLSLGLIGRGDGAAAGRPRPSGGGARVALGARDMFGSLVAGGIVAWLGIQALVNIGGVTGALPMTGLTLPFISYGGSSLSVSIVATAIVLNVARHGKAR